MGLSAVGRRHRPKGGVRSTSGRSTACCSTFACAMATGWTSCAELRAGPAHDVPVIVATAYGDSERTIRAMPTAPSIT